MTSLIDTQKNLEELFSKNQLIPVLKDQFKELTENEFYIDVLVHIYLHKQTDIPTMVGILSPKWGEPQDVSDMLLEAAEDDVIDFDLASERFITKYTISKDVEEMLEKFQFPLPMIVKPNQVKNNNYDSGYFNDKQGVILNNKGNPKDNIFMDQDVCLDHINRINSVPLSLNLRVIESEEGKMIKPNQKDGEPFREFRKRVKQAEKFYDSTKHVMQMLVSLGNKFWVINKYDRRGRCYSVGYHISPQGDDYRKAVLELAEKEIIT